MNKPNKKYTKRPESKKTKLYLALLCIYQFYQLKDFLFLKSDYFLKLCEVCDIDWNLNSSWLKKELPFSEVKQKWPFKLSIPLECRSQRYGELLFFSSHKFSQIQKKLLTKITFFVSSTLYFIENKQKMETIKQQWAGAFDSLSQAFCITDKNFKIIRTNQAFQTMSQHAKPDLFNKNLFDVFPIPIKLLKSQEYKGSCLVKEKRQGKTLCWEISMKPLFLKKEKIQTLLFLIKDVTQEIEIEEKLSAQAKDRELGLIKGSIAHELNNPISGIKALLSVMSQQIPPEKPPLKKSFQQMEEAIERCQTIVKELLNQAT